MIPVPTNTKVWLAAGVTDTMGWTPPFAQRQTAGLAVEGE